MRTLISREQCPTRTVADSTCWWAGRESREHGLHSCPPDLAEDPGEARLDNDTAASEPSVTSNNIGKASDKALAARAIRGDLSRIGVYGRVDHLADDPCVLPNLPA